MKGSSLLTNADSSVKKGNIFKQHFGLIEPRGPGIVDLTVISVLLLCPEYPTWTVLLLLNTHGAATPRESREEKARSEPIVYLFIFPISPRR